MTTKENSMFSYEDGKSWSSYNNKSHIPTFECEGSDCKKKNDTAWQVCEGRKACIYDYMNTEDRTVANSTLETQQTYSDEKQLRGRCFCNKFRIQLM